MGEFRLATQISALADLLWISIFSSRKAHWLDIRLNLSRLTLTFMQPAPSIMTILKYEDHNIGKA
jgi:hypothetical protein